jgi:hypothetical protein
MGMPFGKASRRTFKRTGTVVPYRNWNSLWMKSSDTHLLPVKPPSEALERGISMSVFATGVLIISNSRIEIGI